MKFSTSQCGIACHGATLCILAIAPLFTMAVPSSAQSTPSFRNFDQRARSGQRLNVVFFGASLTWGANASDPMLTSYRANMMRRFEGAYPQAHFKFWDAAIGGTGSQLGVFRLDRDVLRHKPDLVFLDFSANDDIYSDNPDTRASYESLVRRLVVQAHVPVVQVIFPFEWNVKPGEMAKMKLRDAHLKISRAYHTAVGDAVALANERVATGKVGIRTLWPIDGVHPGDVGYELFTEAAWKAYRDGVSTNLVSQAPKRMLYDSTYMANKRVRISSLQPLPPGWSVGGPNRVAAYFDFLMSRWLDDEVIASNFASHIGPDGNEARVPTPLSNLKLRFRGTTVLLFGETTLKSGKYRVFVDGKLQEHFGNDKKVPLSEYDAGQFAALIGGNGHYVQPIASGLTPDTDHTLEIDPVFESGKDQELRLESICVAGGAANVARSQ